MIELELKKAIVNFYWCYGWEKQNRLAEILEENLGFPEHSLISIANGDCSELSYQDKEVMIKELICRAR